MPTLTAVLIVKNEAENLAACLDTLSFADEIVIVDSGSTDTTIEIAKKYTDKIFTNTDWQGYGAQRQLAQSHATSDWIFMVDADERVTPELADEIQHAIKQDNQNNVYAVPRLTYCFGAFMKHSGWYPDHVARIYPGNKASYSSDQVHEKLVYDSSLTLVKLKHDLLHYTYNSLEHYLVKSARYADIWSTQKLSEGRRSGLGSALLHGIGCFVRMYIVRAGFLDGRPGLLLALLSAHSTFVKHADLWLKLQNNKAPEK